MYQPMNEQFNANTRQFAESAAQINRLALQNVEHVFGLQMAALQDNANAAFAFLNKMAEVRDMNGFRDAMPNGLQVARENLQRMVSAGQDAYEATLKTNESIGQIARGQFEQAGAQVQQAARQTTDAMQKGAADLRAEAEKTANAVNDAVKKA